jgi:hypothetical protein
VYRGRGVESHRITECFEITETGFPAGGQYITAQLHAVFPESLAKTYITAVLFQAGFAQDTFRTSVMQTGINTAVAQPAAHLQVMRVRKTVTYDFVLPICIRIDAGRQIFSATLQIGAGIQHIIPFGRFLEGELAAVGNAKAVSLPFIRFHENDTGSTAHPINRCG